MQIYFHSRLCSYLSRVPILVEGTVYICRSCFDHFESDRDEVVSERDAFTDTETSLVVYGPITRQSECVCVCDLSLSLSLFIYIYIYIYVCVYIYCICVCACMHVCVCMYSMYMYVWM